MFVIYTKLSMCHHWWKNIEILRLICILFAMVDSGRLSVCYSIRNFTEYESKKGRVSICGGSLIKSTWVWVFSYLTYMIQWSFQVHWGRYPILSEKPPQIDTRRFFMYNYFKFCLVFWPRSLPKSTNAKCI